MNKKVLIVESPSKAKTISRYLENDYSVIASMGHVRDLVNKQGSVDPDNDFSMLWDSDARSKKQLKLIKEILVGAKEVYLATDPDREGEAISWHITQILKQSKQFKNLTFYRVVFHEITATAVKKAMENVRELNLDLINAYLARVALDYLVGYNLSPILWRKLPGSKSAGRVQSVSLRLIVEREMEVSSFNTQEYWSIFGIFDLEKNKNIRARLHTFQSEKLSKLFIKDEKQAQDISDFLKKSSYTLSKIDENFRKRNPLAPFITSTLQQEGARRLGFSTKQTMMIAQQLYEGIDIEKKRTGLITYMRTDSVTLAKEFVDSARNFINENYGEKYLPKNVKTYKTKARNAQEAHEAIRPTDVNITPEKASKYLDEKQIKLYQLIWQRSIACQMESAEFKNMTISISDDKDSIFKASGSKEIFDGFLRIYADEKSKDGDEVINDDEKTLQSFLTDLKQGMEAKLKDIETNQHFTLPPPRYNEASLVQKMEELGIGRPSTYSGIISTLQTRKYVEKVKRKFIPQILGIMVTFFLKTQFEKYLDYNFTAGLEDELDKVSNGVDQWKKVVGNFWKDFNNKVEQAKDLTIIEVLNDINKTTAEFLYRYLVNIQEIKNDNPKIKIDEKDDTTYPLCYMCNKGAFTFKLGKFGPFISCSNYPDCKKIINPKIEINSDEKKGEKNMNEETKNDFDMTLPITLGEDGEHSITLRKGPYGYYMQWDSEETTKAKPKRVSVPKDVDVTKIDLKQALKMGELPKKIGNHPETGEDITVGVGRFGPYVKYNNKFYSVKGVDNVATLSVEDSLVFINKKKN